MPLSSSISQKLLSWYAIHHRDLPWRRTKDPYQIWVSEIMLQQTTVNAVIPYFKKWIRNFPTIESVANASEESILKNWQGLGYYSRAKNIHRTAKILMTSYRGKIPSESAELQKLPGFGPYTSGAVSSIAFGKPVAIVDANIRRVVMRLLCLDEALSPRLDLRIREALQLIFPEKKAGDFNQALMELGALVCRPKEPICSLCSITLFCKGFQRGKQEVIPRPKKASIKKIAVVIGLIAQNKKYFVQRRPATGLLANFWEFPGGKIKKGESCGSALKRELREELDVRLTRFKKMMTTKHCYTQFRATLHVFSCEVDPFPKEDQTHCWKTLDQISQLPLPSGSVKILNRLRRLSLGNPFNKILDEIC